MLYKTVQTQLCRAETCIEPARADVVGEHAQSGADRGIPMKRDEIGRMHFLNNQPAR